MTEPYTTVGIDYRHDHWHIARVRHESGRPTIEQLLRCDTAQLGDCKAVRVEHTVIAVPDNHALVKSLHLNGGGDRSRLAAFEMAQAVLADPADYIFDSYPAGLDGLTIGSAVRRTVLSESVIVPYQQASGTHGSPMPMLRSIALGRGYVAFATPEVGDLTALADLTDDPISLCLVHGGRPVSVGCLAVDRFNLDDDQGCDPFAVELKTVISFKLAALFEDGLTLPLSALLVAGCPADHPLVTALGRYFAVKVAVPQLNTGFLADPEAVVPAASDFLTALGLASI